MHVAQVVQLLLSDLVMYYLCDLKSKYDNTPQSNVEAMFSKFVNWFVFNIMCALFNRLCFCIKSNQCNDRYFYEKNSENEASRK